MKKFADKGFNCGVVGSQWPEKWAQGIPVPGNVAPEEWDAFHSLIVRPSIRLVTRAEM
jgi:hypothetical protein